MQARGEFSWLLRREVGHQSHCFEKRNPERRAEENKTGDFHPQDVQTANVVCNARVPSLLTQAAAHAQSPSLHKYSFLLLTSAVGIDIVLTKLGSPYIGQAVSGILVFLYLLNFVSLRKAMTSFWSAVMDIFFREISVGGINKLEPLEDGRAVIFACAPHVNQFIDPILVMKAVAESTGRHVSWMAAQKSFDRKAIGAMATALKAIPVVRPDDLERKGKGFITCRGVQVYGHAGTAFTRDFVKGALLVVKTNEGKCTAKVVKVFDDFHMEIAEPGLTVVSPPPPPPPPPPCHPLHSLQSFLCTSFSRTSFLPSGVVSALERVPQLSLTHSPHPLRGRR
jgi:hypothetical protein